MENKELDQKLKETLKKLMALAERGVGGEAVNAEMFLKRLMAKHNLTVDDLTVIEKRPCVYFILKKHESIFWQCYYIATNTSEVSFQRHKYDKRKIEIKLTPTEELMLTEMFNWYAKIYDDQLREMNRNFMDAFIHAQDLYSTVNKSKGPRKSLTPEEYDNVMAKLSLANSIEKKPFRKRVASGHILDKGQS